MGATPKPTPESGKGKHGQKIKPKGSAPATDAEAEAVARISEERFRLVSLATNDAVWDWDLEQDRTTWGEGLHAIFGYPHQEGPREQKWWDERVHPEDRERVASDLYGRLGRGEQFWSAEYRFRRADGTYADVHDRGYVIRDAGRRPLRVVGAMTDISERKRAERLQSALYRIGEAARSAEDLGKLYASIHAILSELMYARNCYIALYDAASRTLSFPYFIDEHDEALAVSRPLGRGMTEFVLRTGQPLLAPPEVFEELVRRGETDLVGTASTDWMGVPLRSPGGETFGVLALQTYRPGERYTPRDLDVLTFVSQQIASAIEHKRREQALRESERKFRVVAETAAAAIYIHDGSNVLFVNPAAEEISGYAREELMAMEGLDLVHPDHRDLVRPWAGARRRGDGAPSRHEFKILTKSGETRWLDLTVNEIQFEGRTAMLAMAFDLTERKRAERLQSALYRIGEVARSAEDLEKLYASIHAILGELMYARNCYIALYDETTDTVSFPYFVDEKDPPPPRRRFGEGATEYVLRTGQPTLTTREKLEELAQQGKMKPAGTPALDWLGVPLKKGETTFGALVLQTYEENIRYGDKEKEILTFVSQQIATAIEQKRRERALRESEAKFRAVAETAAAAIVIHDGAKLLFVNRTAEVISGYTREELLAMGPFDPVHPEHREMTRRRAEARQHGDPEPTRYEFKILHKSGETRWLDFSASTVQFEGRSAVLSMAFDITERKRAEALQSALYRIAEKARSAEALPELYASIHAILGELMYAKNCYIALYDPATDMVSFPYFVDEKDPPFPPHKFGRGLTEYILRTGEALLATPEKLDELTRRDEVRRMGAASLDWMGVPLKRGGQTFGALVLQSYEPNIQYGEKEKEILTFVSQQIAAAIEGKRSEEAIRESESKFRAVAEWAAVAIGIVDRSGLVYVNPTFEAVTGYHWAELRTMDPWTVVRPDHRARMQERMRARLQGQSADSRYEVAILTKSGEERWLDFSAEVIEIAGQPAILGSAVDVTERKRAEQIQSALYRISEQAAAAEDLPQLFASLHAIVGELMYARNFYIALYDAAAGILSFPYFVDEEDVAPAPKELGKGLTEYVLRTGEPLLASPEVFDDLVRRGEAENIGAPSVDWLGAPLKSGATTFGVLVLQSYTENVRFNEKQKDILTFVSQHVATAIERKRAQDAVRDSEERYRRVVEVSPDAIYINSRGNFVYANPAALRFFRADTAEDLIGTPVMDRIHPDYKQIVQERIRETSEGGHVPLLEEKFLRLDGTAVDVEVVATSLVYEGEPAALVVLREITERKLAEAALRDSEARYRKQVEGAVYGIYRSGVNDRFLEVNPALVSMLGYASAEELLSLNLSRDVYLDPGERSRLIQNYRHSEHVENVETRWKKKDGTPIEVRLSGRAVFDAKGEAESFEMIAEDVTERRSLEQQLRQSQKMEAVGRLAGGVAHDFNNLLTVIKGYSELMLEQTIPGGPLRAEVEEVKKAAERAASLTRQLLAFSRQQVLAPKILDLNAAVGNMEQMLRRLLGEDIELSTVLGEKLGQVKADPGQVEQVLMNLAVNSRDAMSRGGKLTIETANAILDENYMREHGGVKPGSYVMLAVSDTGAGMDEETRSRVFEPFFTTKEMGKGTGLGLSTVYGIVKQSEGYIWVYSEAGFGTTFKVYLPRVDESAEDSQKVVALGTGDRGSETILLVEDEDGVRALVKQVLSRQGYTVIETRHGREALAEVERHSGPIPMLLTDVVLPQMSGRELAERLKVLRPDMKVLYMSGYTDDAILRHGVIDQETAFLQKPFTTSVLVRKVREVLDQPA